MLSFYIDFFNSKNIKQSDKLLKLQNFLVDGIIEATNRFYLPNEDIPEQFVTLGIKIGDPLLIFLLKQ